MRGKRRFAKKQRRIIDRAVALVIESLEARRLLSSIPIYVDQSASGAGTGSSWANAFTDLQSALNAALGIENASPGTAITIDVAQGNYKPTSGTDRTATFQLIDNVSILGGFAGDTTLNPGVRNVAAYATILSGDIGIAGNYSDDSYNVVTGSGTNSTACLDGVTIFAGSATGTGGNGIEEGGGLFNDDGSPTINLCTFSGDEADYGGAIENQNYSSPMITDCTFDGDAAASEGGAIYDGYGSSPVITNCTFTDDTAYFAGGAINDFGGSPTITHCNFNDNAAESGGAIYSNSSSLTITGCTFSGNDATKGGAIDNYQRCSPTILDCIFSGNQATYGGAIDNCRYSAPAITNCAFSGDEATYGGAISNNQEINLYSYNYAPKITNCTFYGEQAASGGAIYSNSASPTVTNCIIWGDGPDALGGQPGNVTYSDVDQSGYAGSNNNIDQNPMFVSDTDLELQNDSQCIDAGNNAAVPANITTDLAGGPRIINGTMDMGAYEFLPGFLPAAGAVYSFTTAAGGQITLTLIAGSVTLTSNLSDSLGNCILSIGDGTTVTLAASQIVGGLQLTGSGTLDITNCSVIINYGVGNPSPLTTIQEFLASGYNGGAWNGTGIISSTAAANPNDSVGYADGSVDSGTFAQAGQVLIKCTLAGDANLDGTDDFNDLFALGQHLNTTGNDWADGNFNYSPNGTVDFNDLFIIGQNLNEQAYPAAASAEVLGGKTLPLSESAAVAPDADTPTNADSAAVVRNLYNQTSNTSEQPAALNDPADDILQTDTAPAGLLNN